jgi:hypothetical protein
MKRPWLAYAGPFQKETREEDAHPGGAHLLAFCSLFCHAQQNHILPENRTAGWFSIYDVKTRETGQHRSLAAQRTEIASASCRTGTGRKDQGAWNAGEHTHGSGHLIRGRAPTEAGEQQRDQLREDANGLTRHYAAERSLTARDAGTSSGLFGSGKSRATWMPCAGNNRIKCTSNGPVARRLSAQTDQTALMDSGLPTS